MCGIETLYGENIAGLVTGPADQVFDDLESAVLVESVDSMDGQKPGHWIHFLVVLGRGASAFNELSYCPIYSRTLWAGARWAEAMAMASALVETVALYAVRRHDEGLAHLYEGQFRRAGRQQANEGHARHQGLVLVLEGCRIRRADAVRLAFRNFAELDVRDPTGAMAFDIEVLHVLDPEMGRHAEVGPVAGETSGSGQGVTDEFEVAEVIRIVAGAGGDGGHC